MAGPKFLSEGKTTRLLFLRRLCKVRLWMGSRLELIFLCGHCDLIDLMNESILTRYSIGISDLGGAQELRKNNLGAGFGGRPANQHLVKASQMKRSLSIFDELQ